MDCLHATVDWELGRVKKKYSDILEFPDLNVDAAKNAEKAGGFPTIFLRTLRPLRLIGNNLNRRGRRETQTKVAADR
jgi:hypothetical protein